MLYGYTSSKVYKPGVTPDSKDKFGGGKVSKKLPKTTGQYTPGQGSAGQPRAKGNPAAPPPLKLSTTEKPVNPAQQQMAATPGPISSAPVPKPVVQSPPNQVGGIAANATATGANINQTGNGGAYSTGDVTDPFTGFAARYDPRFTQQLYSNPNLIYQDVMRSMGLPVNNTILAESGDYAQNLRDLAGLLAMAGAPQGSSQSEESLINTWAKLLQGGMGPGGNAVDYHGALNLLFNPGDRTSALSEYLLGAPGDTTFGLNDQAQALGNLFGAAISGVNPYTQQAMASAFRGAQNQLQGNLARGEAPNPNLLNYLRKNLAGVIPGL